MSAEWTKARDVVGQTMGSAALTGWAYVEASMERVVGTGLVAERLYREHFEQAGLMPSWQRYNAWKLEHPDEPVPPEINRVVSLRDDLRQVMDRKPGEPEEAPECRDLA